MPASLPTATTHALSPEPSTKAWLLLLSLLAVLLALGHQMQSAAAKLPLQTAARPAAPLRRVALERPAPHYSAATAELVPAATL